jgi:hypothetical protein
LKERLYYAQDLNDLVKEKKPFTSLPNIPNKALARLREQLSRNAAADRRSDRGARDSASQTWALRARQDTAPAFAGPSPNQP